MILFFLACVPEPQLQAIGDAVGTGFSVGWAAAVAAEADQLSGLSCIQRTQTCNEEPCGGAVEIDLSDPECAFPFGENTTGTIEAAGTWTGTEAILALRFQDMSIDGGSLWNNRISAVTVTHEDELTRVVFADQSIEGLDTDEVVIGQSGWVIDVDLTNGPSNTRMTMDGGGQRVGADEEVVQLASVFTVMEAGCRQNPVAGLVTMERVLDVDAGITGVTFRNDCDGKGKLEASLGRDVVNSQRVFDIDMWDR